jgi:hypothetical protein
MRLLDGIAIRSKSTASAVYFIEKSKYNTHMARMDQGTTDDNAQ